MAITKVAFSATTSRATMGDDLYSFLHTYGTDYFDSVEQGTNEVNCIIDGVTVLSFKCTASTCDTVRTVGSSAVTTFPTVAGDCGWYAAGYVTSKGLYIQRNRANKATNSGVYIFKDDDGRTAFCTTFFNRSGTSTSQNIRTISTVFAVSTQVNVWFSFMISSASIQSYCDICALNCAVASLAPTALDPTEESIADGFYFVPMSPYRGVEGRLTVGGKEYVYNGLFALEE